MGAARRLKKAAMLVAGVALIAAGCFVYDVRRAVPSNSHYVALGSSYAAGLSLGPRAPGSPIVSQRSVNGYPQQLAKLLEVPSFTDMSSSGATVLHVWQGGQMMLRPQIDALGPETRLVTLTGGGNDVGYVGDITMMAFKGRGGVMGSLASVFWKGARPVDARGFPQLEANVRGLVKEIARRSPRARIVVVTYPVIIPALGNCAKLGLTDEQAKLMRAVGDKLADVTRAAATSAGATLVDMARLSEAHSACSGSPWVNGFRPKTGADFHPTLEGARATAEAIRNSLRDVPL